MALPNSPKVSFCTTCMGRLEHLKRTLPQNIADAADYPNTQFVVVNYGGEKDTENWVKENFPKEIASGKLKYVSFPEATKFRHSHAKNIAHRMADGDILCNVDADQFLGKGFAQFVAETFRKADLSHRHIYMRHSPIAVANDGNRHGSSLGKIALLKKDYEALRGYNENINIGRGDDTDLNARMMLRLMRNASIPLSFANGIEHTDAMRVELMDDRVKGTAAANLRTAAVESSGLRSIIGKAKRVTMHMVTSVFNGTNNPQGYGMGEVFVNFSPRPVRLSKTAITEDGAAPATPLTDTQLMALLQLGPFLDKVEAVTRSAPGNTPAMRDAVEASIALQRDAANLYADQPAEAAVTRERVADTLTELYEQYTASKHTGHRAEFKRAFTDLGIPVPASLLRQ
ncbi:MAG: glycosyltransferase [Proteobacteria bacterium]|nr:glycosyltransferase [Pseudomonadota bacterium]